ncbi:uncharacterized protein DS421_7g217230 [Arachis hypogaea]|nr:uncharacterized protein DS421_7g217230 [Arachis hypogaea]
MYFATLTRQASLSVFLSGISTENSSFSIKSELEPVEEHKYLSYIMTYSFPIKYHQQLIIRRIRKNQQPKTQKSESI